MPDKVRAHLLQGGVVAISIALAACVGELSPPSGDAFAATRQACNHQYLRRIGNYLPHAVCVNDAIERLAIPTARYRDLVRLQEDARVSLSEKIDTKAISVRMGERQMRQVDALVAQAAARDRDTGNDGNAARRIAAIDRILSP
jgi:hypothetical protein